MPKPLDPIFMNTTQSKKVVKNSIKHLLSSEMILKHGKKLKWIAQRMER